MNPILRLAYLGWFLTRPGRAMIRREMRRLGITGGRRKLGTGCDMLRCAWSYGASFDDYFSFRYDRMSAAERLRYISARDIHQFQRRWNRRSHRDHFRDKAKFARTFAAFMHRETCNLDTVPREEAVAWLSGREAVIAKPQFGLKGIGVKRVVIAEHGGPDAAWLHLRQGPSRFLEEVVVQHPTAARFHPDSVNTIRIITLRRGSDVQIFPAYFRMGNGGVADNFSSGGVSAPVDLETGQLGLIHLNSYDPARLECHPRTGVRVCGERLEGVATAVALAREAAFVVPEVASVGWDVALTPTGACLIEGNDNWAHGCPQVMHDRGLRELLCWS